jgi:hypothetical protein
MKKNILLLLVVVFFYNCSSKINENEIIGNWKVVEFMSNTPELSPILIEATKNEALSSNYSFHKDKTFKMKSDYKPNGESGKFKFTSKKRTFELIFNSGNKNDIEKHQIVSLDANLMKWTQNIEGIGSLSMTLKRE